MLLPYLHSEFTEAGCDEAGRGCLAGPVYAAAVLFPKDFRNEMLNDSKCLNEKKRYALREIIEREAISWGLGIVEAAEIDKINILNASILAMHRAIIQLKPEPEFLIIDGNCFRYINQLPLFKLPHQKVEEKRFEHYKEIPSKCIIKGDGKYLSIAAASILAKTYRYDYMNMLYEQDPRYNWKSNKGYPTIEHRAAIHKFGKTEHHRKSFKLLDNQLSIKF
jgi:ribonuclease HII